MICIKVRKKNEPLKSFTRMKMSIEKGNRQKDRKKDREKDSMKVRLNEIEMGRNAKRR